MTAPLEFFVWYRADADQAPRIMAAAQALLARISSRCAVQGRLLQRQDHASTWMEHYRVDGTPAVVAALRAEMQAGWPADLPERHIETFVALPAEAGAVERQ